MKIEKKSLLIELLSGAQVLCLTGALIVGFFWVRASINNIVREQIMEDNKLFAAQMSKLIQRSDVSTIEYGTDDWKKLQTLIEEVSLPNDGYMCITESKEGNLV
ncbi:MAG: hypothetical protein AAGG48_31760 [Planctomycetota bacterium]